MTQNCWIFLWFAGVTKRRAGVTKRDTSYYHFLFYVRNVRYVRHARHVRYGRFIRVLNSIREIRVQKQNVWFVFRFVYSFANARYVGF